MVSGRVERLTKSLVGPGKYFWIDCTRTNSHMSGTVWKKIHRFQKSCESLGNLNKMAESPDEIKPYNILTSNLVTQ